MWSKQVVYIKIQTHVMGTNSYRLVVHAGTTCCLLSKIFVDEKIKNETICLGANLKQHVVHVGNLLPKISVDEIFAVTKFEKA
mmetsp:Transcript_34810/g.68521  ORF Transcript_34810/g.68521 Transcript_34810/m.68521 type:complete len:83 (+) Transcript_34810:1413-1661(+)